MIDVRQRLELLSGDLGTYFSLPLLEKTGVAAISRLPVSLRILDYGAGSSRDWAAKGTRLLGVRAVIARGFERIHRSNLIGHGRFPLPAPRRGERTNARARRDGAIRSRAGCAGTPAPAGNLAHRASRRPARVGAPRAPDRHTDRTACAQTATRPGLGVSREELRNVSDQADV